MPRFRGATYFSLKGGLNTEASPLNIPAIDATAIQNVDLQIDGSIQRKRALDFLGESQSGNLFHTSGLTDYTAITGGVFRAEVPAFGQFNSTNNVGQISKFIVTHVGKQFLVYDYTSPELLREIDNPKQVLTSTHSNKQAMHTTLFLTDNQRVYLVNQNLPFSYLDYNSSTDLFSLSTIRPQHRVNTESASTIQDIQSGTDAGWLAGVLSNSRLWLAGSVDFPNTLFFSQIIVNGDEFSKMYQVADPFSETDSQLVDTDGGSIQLTGAERILAVAPLGSGVIVFANNGVWSIAGQDGFRPTSYSINKISSAGIVGPGCWTEVEQQLIYFGQTDAYTVLLGTAIDSPEVKPIGSKIVSFYNRIPKYNREAGKAVYNPDTKKLYFFCNFEAHDWLITQNPNRRHCLSRDALIFDVRLAAWTTYRLADNSDGTLIGIGDVAVFDGGPIQFELVYDSGEVITSGGENVTTQSPAAINQGLSVNFLFLKRTGNTWKFSFGELTSTSLIDFDLSSEDRETNTAFITLAHQIFNDLASRKFAPYIIPIFERIETGQLDGNGVDITPGGCLYRVDWDWSVSNAASKFGVLRAAYKPYRYTTAYYDGVDPGIQLVSSRLKIRGRGDVFRLHFESDGIKDFKLYGWQLLVYAKPKL